MEMHNYLNKVTEQIRCKKAHPMVMDELQNHLEEEMRRCMSCGMTEKEAERVAVQQMGDPVETGRQLDRIHRPRINVKLLICGILLIAAGVFIQYQLNVKTGILNTRQFFNSYGGWTVLGIAAAIVIYRLDYTVLGEFPRLIWWGIWGIIFLTRVSEIIEYLFDAYVDIPFFNESFGFTSPFIPVIWAVSYAGILFSFRNDKQKGILKSAFTLLIPFGLHFILASYWINSQLWIGMAACAALLFIAVSKGWFGKLDKAGVPALISVIILFLLISYANLHALMISQQQSGGFGIWHLDTKGMNDKDVLYFQILNARSDTVGKSVFQYMGTIAGIVMILVLITLMAFMILIGRKQKNRLGYLVSTACVTVVFFQSLLHLLANTGVLHLGSSVLPFFTYGFGNYLNSFIIIGIMLSVYSNNYLISENQIKVII